MYHFFLQNVISLYTVIYNIEKKPRNGKVLGWARITFPTIVLKRCLLCRPNNDDREDEVLDAICIRPALTKNEGGTHEHHPIQLAENERINILVV